MSKGQMSSIPSVEGIADVRDVARPTGTARAARVALMTGRTNVSDRFGGFVDCGGPIPTRDRLVVNHRARDPDNKIVGSRAGIVLDNLSLASRQPMRYVGRRTGDRADSV